MNGYLLDTNVTSELRKGSRCDEKVSVWLQSVNESDLFLSVLVVGEIRKGVEQAFTRDLPKARVLDAWLTKLEQNFGDRILPITISIADTWGRMAAIRPLSAIDGLMAATARVNDLTFVTRNKNDVAHTGARLLDPFN